MSRIDRLRSRLHKRKANRERKRRHKQGKRAQREARAVRKIRNLIRQATLQGPATMFDDTSVELIPADAPAAAGYKNGSYVTWDALRARFPHLSPNSPKRLVSIAVSSDYIDADALDIETGDATPADAPGWFKRRREAGHKGKPFLYCPAGEADNVVAEMTAAGIRRGEYWLWTAHTGEGKHRCGPHSCGECKAKADLTQFTWTSEGKSLDESYLSRHVLA